MSIHSEDLVNVLMVGTGEYTTGYVDGKASDSDKGAGVVALVMLDLRKRGKTGRLALCGVNGRKFPGIRRHMQRAIGDVYKGLDLRMETFPEDEAVDPAAYIKAMDSFKPGDAVIIFTPDDTHYEIARAAVERGLHVLVTKPVVKTLEEHKNLWQAARERGVLIATEVHKRWDPIYVDARDRIQGLGDFSFLTSYMSQPKHQLDTFRRWAGKSSDISYYLNSHHIDFHEWVVLGRSRPVRVTGVATGKAPPIETEDTITLSVLWQNNTGTQGHAIYTASWAAPRSDVHSQQRFFYMGHKGEINVDQAHRGYSLSTDEKGFSSANPLFMKYTPSNGEFAGQLGYGYRSLEAFIEAVAQIKKKEAVPSDYDGCLATLEKTMYTTAILEAGRRSLDTGGLPMDIVYPSGASFEAYPEKLVPSKPTQ